jgi:hypothetical protein
MLTLITPTRDRPEAFALLERWIGPQLPAGCEWLVVNDGTAEYACTRGQQVLRRDPANDRHLHSLCANVLEALDYARGDKVLIVEDDDWYAPGYIEAIAAALDHADIAGFAPALYYRADTRVHRCMNNRRHCSLAMSGFRAELIPVVREIASRGRPYIDIALWSETRPLRQTFLPNTHKLGAERIMHVGMKGLPGTPGIGVGHSMSGRDDRGLEILRQWMGGDADAYAGFYRPGGEP